MVADTSQCPLHAIPDLLTGISRMQADGRMADTTVGGNGNDVRFGR